MFARAVRRSKERNSKLVILPSSCSTCDAPGYVPGPLITACRNFSTFQGVTGSGNVNFWAMNGGIPISLVSMFGSGEMTERAA